MAPGGRSGGWSGGNPADNDPEEVGKLAERIRAEVEAATFEIGEGRVARTTCSIGYACYPFAHGDPELYGWEDILNLADSALYAAKAERNAWVGYLNTGELRPRGIAGSPGIDPARSFEEGALRAAASSPRLAWSRRPGQVGRAAYPALA